MNRTAQGLLACTAVLFGARSAVGQTPTASSAPFVATSCTYDSCALAIERGFWGQKLRRGLNGPTQGIGFGSSALVRAVTNVADARREAEIGRSRQIRGNITTTVAALVGALWMSSSVAGSVARPARLEEGLWVWAGLSVPGVIDQYRAQQNYSRAVFLYNRQLPR